METSKQYQQINNSLNRLHYILKKLGVSEFSISQRERNVILENDHDIDENFLNAFCRTINSLYNNEMQQEAN